MDNVESWSLFGFDASTSFSRRYIKTTISDVIGGIKCIGVELTSQSNVMTDDL